MRERHDADPPDPGQSRAGSQGKVVVNNCGYVNNSPSLSVAMRRNCEQAVKSLWTSCGWIGDKLAPYMRALLQRVSQVSVTIDDQVHSEIGAGLLILLGIEEADDREDIDWLVQKITKMRIFGDAESKMNCSLLEVGGEALVVSQFTLHANTRKGNRPSFIRAAAPAHSEPLYEEFCSAMEKDLGKSVGRGVFGADMQVGLINDGPVTIWIDSKNRE